MQKAMDKLEELLELGGTKKDITMLIISGIALIVSIFDLIPLPFDASWVAIILCGLPIVLEAVIGLVTAFDIKADVLVSMALIASVCIGRDHPRGDHTRCVLSMCARARNADGDHGCDRQCDKARLSRARGGCARTACPREKDNL